MKKQFLSLFGILCLLISSLFSAQDLSSNQTIAIQKNDVAIFKKNFTPKQYNQCFNVKDEQYTPYMFAVRFEKKEIIDFLQNSNVKVQQACKGVTPLMIAATYGRVNQVTRLLAAGADKNAKSDEGLTAREYALKNNYPNVAEQLK